MNLKPSYITLALALALAACSDKEPNVPIINEENPMLMSFSITMENPNGSRATRADAPNGWDPNSGLDDTQKWNPEQPYFSDAGTFFDCALKSKYFTPVIVENNDPSKIAGQFKILSFYPIEGTDYTTYFIHGSFLPGDEYDSVEKLQKAGNLNLMIFANTPSDPASVTGGKYEDLEFEYISSSTKLPDGVTTIEDEGFDAVPMWGVCPVSFKDAKPGSYSLINKDNPCNLLRAMAKVSIQLRLPDYQKERVNLVSIELNKYNTKGYVTPNKWNSIASTDKLGFNETIREHSASLKMNEDQFVPFITERVTKNSGEDNISFYLPEIVNTNSKDDCLELTVNYTVDGNPKSNHLYITKYENGGPAKVGGEYQFGQWDVVRNHIYEFTITGVQDSKITVQARVNDWKYHKGEPQPLE